MAVSFPAYEVTQVGTLASATHRRVRLNTGHSLSHYYNRHLDIRATAVFLSEEGMRRRSQGTASYSCKDAVFVQIDRKSVV